MAKESQIPVRIISVSEPSTHKHEAPVDPKSRGVSRLGDSSAKFHLSFRGQNFIGVQNQNPLIGETQMFQCPVLFLWPGAIELELNYLRTMFLRDPARLISTLRIDNKNLTRPGD